MATATLAFGQSKYQRAPDPIGAMIDAPLTPVVKLSPNLKWALLTEYPGMMSLAELAEPELRLAGLRFKPGINGPSRVLYGTRIWFRNLSDLTELQIQGIPSGSKLAFSRWSPDGQRIAFCVNSGKGFSLWTASVDTPVAREIALSTQLNAVSGSPFQWLPDSQRLLCLTIPADRGDCPVASVVPDGPVVHESLGRVAPARTYQDLLKNSHDESLFAYYLQSQLECVSVDGDVTRLGAGDLISSFEPSPNGEYILVETLHTPFSYAVPASRFPKRVEIWDRQGNVVKTLADLPLQDQIPIAFGSVAVGPRSYSWRSDSPATLYWVEALDGGDASQPAEWRDKFMVWEAPFTTSPQNFLQLALRFERIDWGNDRVAIVHEWWWSTRKARAWRVQPQNPAGKPEILWDRSWEDRYGDPGVPVTRSNAAGHDVLQFNADGNSIFLFGEGASSEGDRPFVDVRNLGTGETSRLFRSEAPSYERPVALLDETATRLLTRRESVDEPPNYFFRSLVDGSVQQVTEFVHPSPQLQGLTKELLRYERADGVKLTATLYLPPGYKKEQGPLPLILWAYPQEFKSADAAGQVTNSPYRFDRVHWASPLLFLTQGYAVLDDPTMPIVGEGDIEPNDTYVEQLVAGARAAVDEVVRLGVADPARIAVGGHSYGAFMTANLLAHTDLFRAGVARSGAYNRTLTPFGFQSEERTIWQAPQVYTNVSPFMHADKITEPLLLIHGDADNNAGTFPLQSERLYNAMAGLGGTARLVMLPLESHGYQSSESIHHMLWEMAQWLDRYVKSPPLP
ncbi:MAG: prolyl oligopeptidase family serine peptidase [Planctomycetota bacterium]|nr:prolyl oligopeptidase family serine peptidase [Planctomycetota bacterium]MDA1180334.1 prolyl oligopeptidase family serine peptidase [Planctomycetota bacterium]